MSSMEPQPGRAVKCSNCGGLITAADSKYCSFCGALLAVAPTPVSLTVVREIAINAPERFDAAERDPRLPGLMAQTPKSSTGCAAIAMSLFLVVFILFGMMLAAKASDSGLGAVLLLVPLFGIVLLVAFVRREIRIADAPIERRIVVVMDERTKIEGGGHNSSASTTYYALLEARDGARREYEVDDEIAGTITRGDIGVVYLKTDRVLGWSNLKV
jgi:hypothetical protein